MTKQRRGWALHMAATWVALIGTGSAHAQSALETLYSEAKQAQQTGDLTTAAAKYEGIVKLQPRMAEAYANLGNLYYQQGQLERASAAYEKAIQLKPDLAGPSFFLGVIAFGAHDYPEALRHLKRAVALDPENPLIESYLGYTYYARSKFRDAAGALEAAANKNHGDIDILYQLNKTYAHLADDAYGELQRNFADSFYALLARAHAYESQENWKSANEQYAIAAKLRPENQRLQEKLKWTAAKAADPNVPPIGGSPDPVVDASLVFRDVHLSKEKLAEEIGRWQADVHAPSKGGESAERTYQIAEGYQVLAYLVAVSVIEVDPDSYRAHQLQAQAFETSNKDEAAIAEYKNALAKKPDLQNIHFAIGSLLWKNQSFDAARVELLEELKVNPKNPEALYELGDIAATAEETERAEEYLKAALAVDASMVEPRLALEKIYTQSGQYQKALEQLKRVQVLVPGDSRVHYRLAAVYRKLGKTQEAERELAIFSAKGGNGPNPK